MKIKDFSAEYTIKNVPKEMSTNIKLYNADVNLYINNEKKLLCENAINHSVKHNHAVVNLTNQNEKILTNKFRKLENLKMKRKHANIIKKEELVVYENETSMQILLSNIL